MSGLRLGPHHWVQGRVGEQQVPLQGRGTEVTTKMNEMFRIAGGSVPACLAKTWAPSFGFRAMSGDNKCLVKAIFDYFDYFDFRLWPLMIEGNIEGARTSM